MITETYASSTNLQLKQAAQFLSLMYSNRYSDAYKMYGFKASENDMVNFFSNCKKSGEFVQFGEATVIYGSDLYISVVHTKGIVQWILCVSNGKVVGWDIRFQGNFRQPTERNQKIKETVQSDAQCAQARAPTYTQAPQSVSQNWYETQNFVPKRVLRAQFEYHVQAHTQIVGSVRALFSSSAYKFEFCLPPNRPYQRHVALFVDPPPAQQNVFFSQGNVYLSLEYTQQPSSIRYTLDIELDPAPLIKGSEIVNNNTSLCNWNSPNDDPRIYLGITHWTSAKIDPNHPRVQQLLPEIIGTSTNEREKVLKIAKWIAKIPYEMPPQGHGWPTLDQYMSNFKYMECGGHALIFCCFARAAGIPARRIFWPYIERKENGGMKFGSHMLAEFFDRVTGTWFPVDATTGPFSETNRDHWGKIPFREGAEPIGLVVYVESIDGKELQVQKAETTNLVMMS